MIRLHEVGKMFPGAAAPAVDRLSLDIEEGELVTLVGPSGCGKTTTLKMINRLIEPSTGVIEVGGRDVTSLEPHVLRRGIGYVIQQVGLFPHRTVRENIGTVPGLIGWDEPRISQRVDELAELVGLDQELLDRYPTELSGGQQQRVGVARALGADPPVLLMDEPFGAVDPIVRARLQGEFLDLQRRLDKTVVFVTHDIDEAVMLGDRTAILNVGGILEQYDTPERILAAPANEFVASFLGSERGLRRLGLRPVSSVTPVQGPVIDISADVSTAHDVMRRHGVEWVGLTDGGRLLGWVPMSEIGDDLATARPRPFLVTLTPTDSLRRALDAVVTGHAQMAVVVDDGVYKGMIDVAKIAAEITG
ncbi:MAG: ABC transporter ATP-binding protein [Actinobacteria bacterium]|nr:ABC transporter ATP-binding protein [Actinomycetota bacterium]